VKDVSQIEKVRNVEERKTLTLENITVDDLYLIDPENERYTMSERPSCYSCDGCRKNMMRLEQRYNCTVCYNFDLCKVKAFFFLLKDFY
jgi:hypothetical protein